MTGAARTDVCYLVDAQNSSGGIAGSMKFRFFYTQSFEEK